MWRTAASRWLALGAVLSAVCAVPVVGAQTPAPTRTPPASLVGVVRDAAGGALADVSVMLLGESAGPRTDSAGTFALRDVPPGQHTVLFRRIGYRSVEYRWPARPGIELQTAVTMTPLPRALERVVVEAPGSTRRRGTSSIGGTVVDSTGNPAAGADVRLAGAGLSTVTDSLGRFEFQLLAAGSYVVRVRHRGARPTNAFMQIVDDDHRGISVKLFDLEKKTEGRDTETESGYGMADIGFDAFDRRYRSGTGGIIFGPADLVRANRMPLNVLLQQYRASPSNRAPRSVGGPDGGAWLEESDCLLIDGKRPLYQPLHTFSSLDMQLVEVYRANAFVDEYVVSQMDAIRECRGSMNRHPAYFVLWTRSAR